jgi:D-tyrosyl-tRNA(Tyr) deacylase
VRLLLQRVSRASVDVDGRTVGQIGQGLLVLAGFGKADAPGLPQTKLWSTLCDKVLDLRIFPDEAGKLNLGLRDAAQPGQGGGLLLVSQFTLYADTRRGRRPSFTDAAPPDVARALYDRLAADLSARCPGPFAQGVFGAEMHLDFVNWGPVTILLDSADFAGGR